MILCHIGHFFYRKSIPLLPSVCDALIRIFHNLAIYSCSKIGSGTVFGYGGIAVVIHKRTVIGENCMIGSCVTIGGKSGENAVPVIGDYCYIATGAKILGPVRIGNGGVIGANAVVVKDVPDYCLVVGVPAQVIQRNIDPKDYF